MPFFMRGALVVNKDISLAISGLPPYNRDTLVGEPIAVAETSGQLIAVTGPVEPDLVSTSVGNKMVKTILARC